MIGTSVIDYQYFEILASLFQDRINGLRQKSDPVIGWYDDGEIRKCFRRRCHRAIARNSWISTGGKNRLRTAMRFRFILL